MERKKKRALDAVIAAVLEGRRCPTREEGMKGSELSALARDGVLAIEVSSKNWRRVTLLTGPHAGKSTARNPLKHSSVYLTIDKSGTRRNGRLVDSGAPGRQQPSKPGLLPYVGKERG